MASLSVRDSCPSELGQRPVLHFESFIDHLTCTYVQTTTLKSPSSVPSQDVGMWHGISSNSSSRPRRRRTSSSWAPRLVKASGPPLPNWFSGTWADLSVNMAESFEKKNNLSSLQIHPHFSRRNHPKCWNTVPSGHPDQSRDVPNQLLQRSYGSCPKLPEAP